MTHFDTSAGHQAVCRQSYTSFLFGSHSTSLPVTAPSKSINGSPTVVPTWCV